MGRAIGLSTVAAGICLAEVAAIPLPAFWACTRSIPTAHADATEKAYPVGSGSSICSGFGQAGRDGGH
jgi:hypothetical protein